MTTGVNVDVILNCFFTCKDRASERDRPYQREKKTLAETRWWSGTRPRRQATVYSAYLRSNSRSFGWACALLFVCVALCLIGASPVPPLPADNETAAGGTAGLLPALIK